MFVAATAPAAALSVATVAYTAPSGASATPVSKHTTGIPASRAFRSDGRTAYVSQAAKPIPAGFFSITISII